MLPSAWMMAVACGGGGLLMLILLLRRRGREALATLAATVVVLFLVLIHVAQPALDQVKSPRYLAAEVARHVRPNDAAGMLRWLTGLDAAPAHCVHDEIILSVAEADVEEAARLLERVMAEAFLRIYPNHPDIGLAEAAIGPDWAAAKS